MKINSKLRRRVANKIIAKLIFEKEERKSEWVKYLKEIAYWKKLTK